VLTVRYKMKLQVSKKIMHFSLAVWRTTVAQWLRCCATNRKVAGSILNGVIGIFH